LEKNTFFSDALTLNHCLSLCIVVHQQHSEQDKAFVSVEEVNQQVKIFHQLPHRENPDSRMLLDDLNTMTKGVIHIVNFIPSEVFKQRDFWPAMIMHKLQLNAFTLSW
jgi:hypothetical protein